MSGVVRARFPPTAGMFQLTVDAYGLGLQLGETFISRASGLNQDSQDGQLTTTQICKYV